MHSSINHKKWGRQSIIYYFSRSEVNDARKVVERSKHRITELEASQRDKLSLYGSYTATVHRSIEQYHKQGRFHKKPLGPIGDDDFLA